MTSSSPPAREAQAFGSSASSKLRKGRKTGTSISEQMVGEIFCHWECASCCSGKMQHLCPTWALEQSWLCIICPHFLPQTALVWNALSVKYHCQPHPPPLLQLIIVPAAITNTSYEQAHSISLCLKNSVQLWLHFILLFPLYVNNYCTGIGSSLANHNYITFLKAELHY